MSDVTLDEKGVVFTIELGEDKREFDAFDLAIRFEKAISIGEKAPLEAQVKAIKEAFQWEELSTAQAMQAAAAFMKWMEGIKKKLPWMPSFGQSTGSEEEATQPEPVTPAASNDSASG